MGINLTPKPKGITLQTEIWLPVNVTHEWEGPGGLATLNCALSQVRVQSFLGTLIICIISTIVIAASCLLYTSDAADDWLVV